MIHRTRIRTLLRGIAILLPFILAGTLLQGQALPTARAWEQFVEAKANDEEPILPDFSYAGYAMSEEPIPDVAGPLFPVTSYGAVANDGGSDRDAIQDAINAALAAGGGVVTFPAGVFHLNTREDAEEPIVARGGNIVLRGVGSGRDGTILRMERHLDHTNPDDLNSTPFMVQIKPPVAPTQTITTITADAPRESFVIEVADASRLTVGQWVTVALSDPSAVPYYFQPYTVDPSWERLFTEGMRAQERHRIVALDGNTVTFGEPLHIEINSEFAWQLQTYPHASEVGIEYLRVEGGWDRKFVHHRSHLDDGGWSIFEIDNIVNGWIRDVTFVDVNYPIHMDSCSAFSVLYLSVEGNPGHYGMHARRGYGVLVGLSRDRASSWHGPSMGYRGAGTVYWRYDYNPDASWDAHSGTPYATLIDASSGGIMYGRSGGPLVGMPNHWRYFTLWNFEHTGEPVSDYDFWREDPSKRDRFLHPLLIGVHGQPATFVTANLGYEEASGQPVEPASLFEAQLALRLGELPTHLVEAKEAWEQRKDDPTADYLYVDTIDELHEALANAHPGTRIALEDGEFADVTITWDGNLSANGIGGTADAPIILKAETPGEVILTGNSTLRIAGEHMVVEGLYFRNGYSTDDEHVVDFRHGDAVARHSTLRDCAVVDYNPDDPTVRYSWVSVRGEGNTVERCYFRGMNHSGVQLVVWPDPEGPPNATVIRNNLFADRAPGDGNGFETIRIGTSTVSRTVSNALVEGNLFLACDGEIEIISNKSVGNVYRGNTFRNSQGMLTLRHGLNCTVDGNFFFGEGKADSGGVRLVGSGHTVSNNYFANLEGEGFRAALAMMNGVPDSPLNRYDAVTDATVVHNTFVGNREAFAIGLESSHGDTTIPPADSLIAANVVVSAGGGRPIVNAINTPTNFTFESNLYVGSWLGLGDDAGWTVGDPGLDDGPDGLQRPTADSPVIDALAATLAGVTVDMDGQPRDNAPDLGADEVSDAPMQRRPLTEADVGPTWEVTLEEPPPPPAEVFWEERFDGPDGLLRDRPEWTESNNTQGRPEENTDAITVREGQLRIDMVPSPAQGSLYRLLYDGSAAIEGTFFAGITVTVPEIANPADHGTGSLDPAYFAGFNSSTGNSERARLWITDQDFATQTYRFGITSRSGSRGDIVVSEPVPAGEPQRVVLGFSFDEDGGTTTLWLNPSSADDPSISETDTFSLQLRSFFLRQDNRLVADLIIDDLITADGIAPVLRGSVDPFRAEPIADAPAGWVASPWYGAYNTTFAPWIYHAEHGWQFLGDMTASMGTFIFDLGLEAWLFVQEESYRFVYFFGAAQAGWIYTFPDNTPDSRFFAWAETGEIFSLEG